MKKYPAFLFIMLPFFALCACSEGEESSSSTSSGSTPPAHVHDFSKLNSNAEGHYYQCECGEHEPLEAHNFNKWVIDVQPSLSGSGSAHKECAVCHYHDATINLVDVDSEAALDSVLSAKYPAARITSSFEITKEHYVLSSLTLIATDDVTITRASTFGGDMFVIGVDENDTPVVSTSDPVIFSLETIEKSFVIDGNSAVIYADADNPTVEVKGSAFFVSGLSTLNLSSGVSIQNHKKTSNERIAFYDSTSETKPYINNSAKVGGAAIINIDSTVNISDAVISYNEANNSDNNSGIGGAIFSQGTLNINGGTFSYNKAYSGALVYSIRVINISKATISFNESYKYGAVYLADSQYSNGYFRAANLGDIVFDQNTASASGGAIFVATKASLSAEKVSFTDNEATTNGGAIASKGVNFFKSCEFSNNTCSTKGGAAYIYYGDKTDTEPGRNSKFENCAFSANQASLGSALSFGNDAETTSEHPEIINFIIADIKDCSFTSNSAVKKGTEYGNGTVHIQTKNHVNMNNSSFTNNSAAKNGGGIWLTGESILNLNNISFTGNSAEGGGAIYATDKAKVYGETLTFSGNTTTKNGAAIYAYTSTYFELSGVNASTNVSGNYGGFMYQSGAATVKLSSITSSQNSAKIGGFIYITTTDSTLYIYSGSTSSCVSNPAGTENIYSNTNKTKIYIKGTDTKSDFTYDNTLLSGSGTINDIPNETV